MEELARYPEVLQVAASLVQQRRYLTDLCLQVQQIAAPTDNEQARALWIEERWQQLGLADVTLARATTADGAQAGSTNVYARIPGRSTQPAVLVSAHTDTVFPAETNLAIRVDENAHRIYGPSIGDNSLGVAGLLLLAETLSQLPPPPVDIWLVANSGEEGLGDLRGMRAAVDRLQPQLGACIVIEGMGLRRVVHHALGSRRFRISVTAPGGHSWSDFGNTSAIHLLVQLAADLTKLHVPTSPRTTYNIGRITGGTSINTIAQYAALELDLRSENSATLTAIAEQVITVVQRYRSQAWQQEGVTVQMDVIGDRPGGEIAESHPLVRAAFRSLKKCGVGSKTDQRISSTDANIPLSRGLPAICIGITEGGNAHRTDEWITPTLLPQGMQHLLFISWWTAMWLAGETQ
ncbi:MAG: M20/M25/M40 family metallo-hydrolase [Chloroflexi bacterium]|nr:M20/M25/M40 family metallo-hydrolase [Chloroflexota bacterium]